MKSPVRKFAVGISLFATLVVAASLQVLAQEAVEAPRKILVKTQAVYPTLARSMNIHGVAKVEAVVAPNGTVKSVSVKGGHPLLTQSAVTAVSHWKFEPAPHETKEQVEVQFDLE